MPAAAHYLHDLGATTDLNSPGSVRAANNYNGNGGGTSTGTVYWQSVSKNAQQWGPAAGSTAANPATTGSGSATPAASGGGGGSILDVLTEIVTGDIQSLAATLAAAAVTLTKDIAVGFADLVLIPIWHRNQDAVWFYYQNVLFNKDKQHKPYVTLPATAAFWGLGYALLFGEAGTSVKDALKPVEPRKARVARHVRHLQALPARRELVKPKDVKAETPTKPKPKKSSVSVNHIATLRAVRHRPITIEGEVNNGNRELGPTDRGITTEVPIEQVATANGNNA
jgi:hypothetical protein